MNEQFYTQIVIDMESRVHQAINDILKTKKEHHIANKTFARGYNGEIDVLLSLDEQARLIIKIYYHRRLFYHYHLAVDALEDYQDVFSINGHFYQLLFSSPSQRELLELVEKK